LCEGIGADEVAEMVWRDVGWEDVGDMGVAASRFVKRKANVKGREALRRDGNFLAREVFGCKGFGIVFDLVRQFFAGWLHLDTADEVPGVPRIKLK